MYYLYYCLLFVLLLKVPKRRVQPFKVLMHKQEFYNAFRSYREVFRPPCQVLEGEDVLTTRNQILFGCVARNIETTGAALGLDKMGLNCPKVHRNLTYGEE